MEAEVKRHHVKWMQYHLNARDALGEEEYERCLKEEVWRPVVGWMGFYEVSSWGRVRSLDRETFHNNGSGTRAVKGRIMTSTPQQAGYHTTMLKLKPRCERSTVHKMVMEAFVGLRPLGLDICHNDGNPANNHLLNLRYDTRSNNHLDKAKHGTSSNGEKHPLAKLTSFDVKEIRSSTKTISQLAEQYRVSRATIYRAKTGECWKHIA